MTEIRIEIPEELRELAAVSRIRWQLLVNKTIKEKLEEIIKINRVISKSKLTQEQANELANEVDISLSNRYDKILKKEQ